MGAFNLAKPGKGGGSQLLVRLIPSFQSDQSSLNTHGHAQYAQACTIDIDQFLIDFVCGSEMLSALLYDDSLALGGGSICGRNHVESLATCSTG